jgi:hypothetical protein
MPLLQEFLQMFHGNVQDLTFGWKGDIVICCSLCKVGIRLVNPI